MPELHPALCDDELRDFLLVLSTRPQEVMFGEARFGGRGKPRRVIKKRLRFDAAVAKIEFLPKKKGTEVHSTKTAKHFATNRARISAMQ